MRGAVFHHEVSSWYCSVLIELYIKSEWIITANGNDSIHVRV